MRSGRVIRATVQPTRPNKASPRERLPTISLDATARQRVPKEGASTRPFPRRAQQWVPRHAWQNGPRKRWKPFGRRTERVGKHWVPWRLCEGNRIVLTPHIVLTVSNVFPSVSYGVQTVFNVSLVVFAIWSGTFAAACARGSRNTIDNPSCQTSYRTPSGRVVWTVALITRSERM